MKIYQIIFITGLAFLNTSMAVSDEYLMLTEADIAREANEGVILRSGLDEDPYWESYNQWTCFSEAEVSLYCAKIDYGQDSLPTLRTSDRNGKIYEFDLDPNPDLKCEDTLNEWSKVFNGKD